MPRYISIMQTVCGYSSETENSRPTMRSTFLAEHCRLTAFFVRGASFFRTYPCFYSYNNALHGCGFYLYPLISLTAVRHPIMYTGTPDRAGILDRRHGASAIRERKPRAALDLAHAYSELVWAQLETKARERLKLRENVASWPTQPHHIH